MTQSKEYYKWVKDTNQKDLTGGKAKFVEFCLANRKHLTGLGDLTPTFISIRNWMKANPIENEDEK